MVSHPLIEIKTKRLVLRPWREDDLEACAKMNGDARVMEYFPSTLTREESDQFARRHTAMIEKQGWGFWAVSIPGQADFIGCLGLVPVLFDAHFTPAVEIGWRLAYDYWNQGYATEGAMAALKYGFETLHLDEIVSFTALSNQRSQNVMKKIGMVRDEKDDFEHPRLAEGHPLRTHALYRIKTGHFTQIWTAPPSYFKPYVEVAACYIEIEGKWLVLERAANALEGKTWTAPAGKIEKEETPQQSAIRELKEETGIHVTASQVKEIGKLYVEKPRGMYVLHMFKVCLKERPEIRLSSESTRYMWASMQELETIPLIGGALESFYHFERMQKQG